MWNNAGYIYLNGCHILNVKIEITNLAPLCNKGKWQSSPVLYKIK